MKGIPFVLKKKEQPEEKPKPKEIVEKPKPADFDENALFKFIEPMKPYERLNILRMEFNLGRNPAR